MENKLNILIVAFFFAPDKRVGALRASYWYNELPKEMNVSVSVLTANQDAKGDRIHVIPKSASAKGFSPIKDDGQVWRNDVIDYLSDNSIENPDVVIISGSPFMHFGLSSFFQKKYGAKVILDYRDPFAINPGFNNSSIKIAAKKFYERRFNRKADALVTVNDYCGKLVVDFDNKPNAIIQNGYDETVTPVLKDVDLSNPSFSYTGKYYFDPTPIIEAMHEAKTHIHVAGPDKLNAAQAEYEEVNEKGFLAYKEAVQLVADNDVAIIQTYGEDFQSTTKIFDYVRCGRAILIVSNKHIERGSIHEELKGYPNVFWAKNEKSAIVEAIKTIKTHKFESPDPDFGKKFSRREQMKKLIKLIEEIT